MRLLKYWICFCALAALAACAPETANVPPVTAPTAALPATVAVVSLMESQLHLQAYGLTAFEVSSAKCDLSFDLNKLLRESARQTIAADPRFRYVDATYDSTTLQGVHDSLGQAPGSRFLSSVFQSEDPIQRLQPIAQASGARMVVVIADFNTEPALNYFIHGVGLFRKTFLGAKMGSYLYVNVKLAVFDSRLSKEVKEEQHPLGKKVDDELWADDCGSITAPRREQIETTLKQVVREQMPAALQNLTVG